MRIGILTSVSAIIVACFCFLIPASADEERNMTSSFRANASSFLASRQWDFSPKQVLDGYPGTAWQANGDGVNQWLEVYGSSEGIGGYRVTRIRVLNGYQLYDSEYGDLYSKNNKIAEMTLVWNSQEGQGSQKVSFPDKQGWRDIPVSIPANASIKMKINKVYRGTRWNHLAVTDVEVFCRPKDY